MTLLASPLLDCFTAPSSSALGSYPSFSMRSASSLAFFSASSKSIISPVIFLAPSFCVFFAPNTLAFRGPLVVDVFLRAAEVVTRLTLLAGLESLSVLASGDEARATSFPLPFAPAPRKGEGVRPTTGGVAVREAGGVGFLMEGLSQDEKKSSSGSPAGVLEPLAAAASVMTTTSGNLESSQQQGANTGKRTP